VPLSNPAARPTAHLCIRKKHHFSRSKSELGHVNVQSGHQRDVLPPPRHLQRQVQLVVPGTRQVHRREHDPGDPAVLARLGHGEGAVVVAVGDLEHVG